MISYNFQPKLVKKMGLENLKVYFTCDNLFTIDNLPDVFDPETLNQVNTWAGVVTKLLGIDFPNETKW